MADKMNETNKYFIERYQKYELEDEIENLQKENKKLKKQNNDLKKKNRSLKKKNKHFESTKAYKIWQKYTKLKDKPKSKNNSKNKAKSKDGDFNSKKVEGKSKEVKNLKDIRVALISDQFTYDSYKYEFTPISLHPKTWKKEMKEGKPDLFFCESTWEGHNYKGETGPWRKKILRYYEFEEDNRKVLFEILEYCKENNIPSIYWNKEDPPNYRAEDFSAAETAVGFDYVFTSAEECIKHYEKDFNLTNVYPLMFAGQPKLFNPLNFTDETIEEIVFAGSYYPRHVKRAELMEDILDRIIEKLGTIRIYDRNYYKHWGNFPDRYEKYLLPPIHYQETPKLYKQMKWGLNFNTVTESNTMFARRVFELSLTNTFIITNYSKGVERIFGDNVFYFDKTNELPDFKENYEEQRLNNLYNVLENHNYTKRWKEILDTIGFEYKEEIEDISIIFKIDSSEDLEKTIEKFDAIDYEDKVLKVIITSTNDDENTEELKESLKEKYPTLENIYFEIDPNYKKQVKKDMKSKYWIIISEDLENDFIKKGILHYQYLNKRISISKGDDKFKLGIVNTIENQIIPKKRLDYLDNNGDVEVDTYYI